MAKKIKFGKDNSAKDDEGGALLAGESAIADAHWQKVCGKCGGEKALLVKLGKEDKRKK